MTTVPPDTLSQVELNERYRALGHDFASYGLNLPEDATAALEEGYHAGLARQRRPRNADRFVRKWLQIRNHALARRRAVSEKVTVESLRRLDIAVCPITLVALTHGERKPSDWSIDRLNNNGAYAIGNLAVISARVNHAKGDKGLIEVQRLSEGGCSVEGLAPREWARMFATMYGPCIVEGQEEKLKIRQVAPIAPDTIGFPWQVFQSLLVEWVVRIPETPEFISNFLEALPNNQLRGQVRRMTRLIQEQLPLNDAHHDVWFDDGLFNVYKEFYEELKRCTENDPMRILRSQATPKRVTKKMLSELRFETRGYSR